MRCRCVIIRVRSCLVVASIAAIPRQCQRCRLTTECQKKTAGVNIRRSLLFLCSASHTSASARHNSSHTIQLRSILFNICINKFILLYALKRRRSEMSNWHTAATRQAVVCWCVHFNRAMFTIFKCLVMFRPTSRQVRYTHGLFCAKKKKK